MKITRRSFLQAMLAAPVAVSVLVPVIAKANELIVPPDFELSRIRLDPGIRFEYEMIVRESVAVGYETPPGMRLVDVKHWDYSTAYVDFTTVSDLESRRYAIEGIRSPREEQSVTFEGYGEPEYWKDFVDQQEMTIYAMVAGGLVAFTGLIVRYEAIFMPPTIIEG